MGLRNERAHFGGRVHGVAHLQQGRALFQARQKSICYAALHEHPGAVGADLALGIEVAHHGGDYGLFQVGVVKHQQGRFAAQLHGHALQGSGGGLHYVFASGHRAGDRHLGHAGVRRQQRASCTAPLQHVEHAGRHSGFQVNFGQLHRRGRGQLRGFENHGIARSQGGRRLPAGNLQGVVPGANAHAHAQRLLAGVGESIF